MNLKKLISSFICAIIVFTMAVSVSANVVFEKDFRTSQNLDEFIPSPNAGDSLVEPDFNENGLHVSNMTNNFLTYIVDFEKSGIEFNSDKYYLASFEGKVLVDNPQNYTMILQFLGTGAGGNGDWQNIDSADGSVVVQDGKGYPINEDGTFNCVGLIKPEYISSDRYSSIAGICMWGCYGNNPLEYEVYSMKIEEVDPSQYITETSLTEDAAEPADETEAASLVEEEPEAVVEEEPEATVEEEPAPVVEEEPAPAVDSEPAAAEPAATTNNTNNSSNNTGIIVAVIAVVLVVVLAVVYFLKKKK